MSQKMYKIVFGSCLLLSATTAQVTYPGRFLQKPTLLVFFVAVILVLVFYAKYLYSNNNKLNKHKDRLSRINSDLQAKVINKENRVRAAEATLKIISDNTFDAIVMLDSFSRITFWNTAAEELFGYSQDSVLNCDLIDKIIPKEDANKFRRKYNLDSKVELSQNREIVNFNAIKKDCTQFSAEMKIFNMKYEASCYTMCIIKKVPNNRELSMLQELKQEIVNEQKIYEHELEKIQDKNIDLQMLN